MAAIPVILWLLAGTPPAAASQGGGHDYAARAAETVKSFTLRSRVGPASIPLPLGAVNFFLDHPDLSAFLARRHRLAPYRVSMRGPGESWADDGAGVAGTVALLKRTRFERVYYAQGVHRSGFWPDIKASAAIFLTLSTASKAGCAPFVLSSFDVYVKVHNPFLSDLIKLLRPFLRSSMLRKFFKALSVAKSLGALVARRPGPMGSEILSYPGLSKSKEGLSAARKMLESVKAGLPPCR